ncbi:type IV secretion system protein [Actinomadura sp. WMMB 499]|uniref:type IV secretion system protein n=1 Tax=Actinomadura sp. WMMB 499 TaxID=1219491 RepID=UPI00124567E4|nr:type IV secretion system protein [Actinomadura sp. WMMB 499]QFG24851.1 hypothetical protein F7P10_30685 [Actinomadura sp. WMMB 499]
MNSPRHRTSRLQRSPEAGLDPSVLDARRGRRTRRRRPRTRRSAILLTIMAVLMLSPMTPTASAIPLPSVNDSCRPADNPPPEQYGTGADGLIKPPGYPSKELQAEPVEDLTYYDRYGTAGQTWYAVDMGCSDAMAMMGNALANTTFTLVRAIDRTTISVYQSAASESLLGWLKDTVDDVISGVGETFNARYWSWVVILGAIWLAWWGLVRRRASKVTEGVVWMVAAMVALIWLVARPADFTTLGTKVSEATSAAFNAALPQSDTNGGVCIPRPEGDPDPSESADLDATTRNANKLWVALVCKPWLQGEFGTTDPEAKIVQDNADKLLWSQAVGLPETYGSEDVDMEAKADAYKDVASNIKENHPETYSLFQGKNWQNRLAVAFGALFAALVAGLLILVIAIALIVVKIAFLLLLVAGPIFLGIGIHPGIGRVIAVRWLELLLSMLLKQAALIGVLSLLLWAYGLILGETLPWGLQVMLIALVTGAAFVYRKPFQHLFSAVGYSAVGSRDKSEAHLDKSVAEARKNTTAVAGAVVPGAAGYRLGGRRGKGDAAAENGAAGQGGADGQAGTGALADRRAGGAGAGAGEGASPEEAPVLAAKPRGGAGTAAQGRSRRGAPPLNLPSRAGRDAAAADGGDTGGGSGGGAGGLIVARPGGGSGTRGRSDGGGSAAGGGGGNGSGGTGRGTPRPTSWTGGGKSASSGGGRSGGGAPQRGGGSGGGSAPARGSGGSGGSGGGSGRSGGGPASNVPRPRAGAGGGGGAPAPGAGSGGQAPPPLWGRRSPGAEPPMPFWLRPAEGPSGEPGRDE